MVGARVNDRQVPLTYELKNGDRVEIVTSNNSSGPSRDWLSIVKSAQARSKINQWFKQEFKENNISKGKELLSGYCKSKGYNLSDYSKPEMLKAVMSKYNFQDWDSVLAAIGHGALKEGQVMNKLIEAYNKKQDNVISDMELMDQLNRSADLHRRSKYRGGIIIKGVDGVAVYFSKCCSPVPGDEIVGFVTRGRGISIHRTDCVNVMRMGDMDRSRLIDAEWQIDAGKDDSITYSSELKIYATDRTGMLFDVSKVFTEANINVTAVNTKSSSKNEKATLTVAFDIRTVEQLNQVIAKLRMVPGVLDVERSVG